MAIADTSLTSIRLAKQSTSETNTLTSTAAVTAGTFTLTIFGQVTTAITGSTGNAASVQAALETLFGVGSVTCTDSGPGTNFGTSGHIVTLNWAVGKFQGRNIGITIQAGGLTPASSIALATTVEGGDQLFGTPATGVYQEARMASEDLGQDKEVVTSDEIVGDRRNPDNIQVNSSAGGDWQSEVIGGLASCYPGDLYLAALGQAGWWGNNNTSSVQSTGTITADNVGGNADRITLVHSSVAWAAFGVGAFVLVSGFTLDSGGGSLAYLNAAYQVVSVSGTTLTLTRGPRVASAPKTTATLVGAPVTVVRYGEAIDSTSLQYFTLERKYSIPSSFARLADEAVKGFDLVMQPKRPLRLTWHLMGKDELDASAALGSSVLTAPGNKSMAPVADFKGFAVDADGHSFSLTSFSLKVDGGLYSQDEEAGTLGPQGTGLGTFKVSGRIEFYYEGGTLFTAYQLFQDKALFVAWGNAANDGLFVAIPRVNFINGRRGTPGKDQATKGWLEFQAAKGADPLLGAFPHLIKMGIR